MSEGRIFDETEYSIPEMENLRDDVQEKINSFQSAKESLDYTMNDIHNYWSTSEGAEAVYSTLIAQYNRYSAALEEGKAQMQSYVKMIDEQIEKYGGAETTSNNAVAE